MTLKESASGGGGCKAPTMQTGQRSSPVPVVICTDRIILRLLRAGRAGPKYVGAFRPDALSTAVVSPRHVTPLILTRCAACWPHYATDAVVPVCGNDAATSSPVSVYRCAVVEVDRNRPMSGTPFGVCVCLCHIRIIRRRLMVFARGQLKRSHTYTHAHRNRTVAYAFRPAHIMRHTIRRPETAAKITIYQKYYRRRSTHKHRSSHAHTDISQKHEPPTGSHLDLVGANNANGLQLHASVVRPRSSSPV